MIQIPNSTETISAFQAVETLKGAKGMVSVYFAKRGDGTLRRMNGFLAEKLSKATREKMIVSGDLKGTGSPIDFAAHNLLSSYEMVSVPEFVSGKPGKPRRTVGKQFRSVPIEGIQAVRCNGRTYRVA